MKTAPLWQISVTVPRQAEEGTAALLERLFQQSPAVYAPEEKGTSVVTAYSRRPQNQRSQRRALREGLRFLAQCGLETADATISIRKVRREDWTTSWKKYFKLIEIGSALLIKPSWTKRVGRPNQAVVTLDPGLSFGTGQHPTTAFCLEQLVQGRKTGHSQAFLDVGTGSGILAICAAKLGYSPVLAFDNDPMAVRVARSNARRNRVDGRVEIRRADLTRLPVVSRKQYHVVCANLIADLLIAESERILNRLKPGGRLVLAGVLAGQFDEVADWYTGQGLRMQRARREGEWKSGAFGKPL